MKIYKTILASMLVVSTTMLVRAQNQMGKADDKDRIAIAPIVDQELPTSAKNLLESRMEQVLTKNGMAAVAENAIFLMKAEVNELSKDITATSPPMHAMNLEIAFSIIDRISGNVAHSTSIQVRGVGSNESKAYIQGIKQINASSPDMRRFVDLSKEKILEYYNSQCDDILKYAQTLVSQGKNNHAIALLNNVPGVAKECYMKCMDLAATIEPVENTASSEQIQIEAEMDEDEWVDAEATPNNWIVEVKEGVFLTYVKNKTIGEKLFVDFQFDNTTGKEIEFYLHQNSVNLYDAKGNTFPCKGLKFTNNSSYYIKGLVLPETPMVLTMEFEKPSNIKVIRMNIFDNTFRYNDIPLQ
jgi:hypothetical protein